MQIRQCGAILAEKRTCLPHSRRHYYHRLTEDGSSFHYALGSSALSTLLPAAAISFSPPLLFLFLFLFLFSPTSFLSFQLLSPQSFIVSHSFASISVASVSLTSLFVVRITPILRILTSSTMRAFASLAVLMAGALVQRANAQADYGYLLIPTSFCSQFLMVHLEHTMATTMAALMVILAATQAVLPAVVLTVIPTASRTEIQVDFQTVPPLECLETPPVLLLTCPLVPCKASQQFLSLYTLPAMLLPPVFPPLVLLSPMALIPIRRLSNLLCLLQLS
ncbi:hypothetical protein HDV63DRAFT_398341 [Trichoderma sp. SZMC 28014]